MIDEWLVVATINAAAVTVSHAATAANVIAVIVRRAGLARNARYVRSADALTIPNIASGILSDGKKIPVSIKCEFAVMKADAAVCSRRIAAIYSGRILRIPAGSAARIFTVLARQTRLTAKSEQKGRFRNDRSGPVFLAHTHEPFRYFLDLMAFKSPFASIISLMKAGNGCA